MAEKMNLFVTENIPVAELVRKMDLNVSDDKDDLNINAVMDNINKIYIEFSGRIHKLEKSSKSEYDATKAKIDEAHESWKKKCYGKAVSLLTCSIAMASSDSKELASAYIGRAKSLFQLNDYKSCLLDINRALKVNATNKPKDYEKKIHGLKKQCLTHIKRKEKKSGGRNHKAINPEATDSSELGSTTTKIEDTRMSWRLKAKFDNMYLPNTTSKIKLAYNDKWGRHMVATEDIDPGEIISCEKFFSLQVDSSRLCDHCSHCLKKYVALIPCDSCSMVLYCSIKCRTLAYESYHRTECKLAPYFTQKDKLSCNGALFLRFFLIGTEQGSRLPDLMKEWTIYDIFKKIEDPTGRPFVNDYCSLLNVNVPLDKELMIPYQIMALEVVMVLRQVGFFGSPETTLPDRLSDLESFSVLLLINHFYLLKTYAFNLNGFYQETSDSPPSRINIGTGICILSSMANHSCNPNLYAFFQDGQYVLFTTRQIKSGEQLFISYGKDLLFQNMTIQERAEKCKMRGFVCQCEACEKDWPILYDLIGHKIKFVEENKKLTVIQAFVKMANSIIKQNSTERMSRSKSLEVIIQHLKFLCNNLQMPSYDILQCQELLKVYMLHLYEEFYSPFERTSRQAEDLDSSLREIAERLRQNQ